MVHAHRRRLAIRAAAASSLLFADGIEEWGSELAGLLWIGEVNPTDLCRVLVSQRLPGVSLTISAKRQAQLEAAGRRIDHYSRERGAWVRYVAVIIETWAEGGTEWVTGGPRSLGALAIELRREANDRRYGAQLRKRTHLRPLASSRERQKVKRWRLMVRQLEAETPGAGRILRRPREL